MKNLEHTFATYVYSHCNICNIPIYFYNIYIKHFQHAYETPETLETYTSGTTHSSRRRPSCLASLEAVAKYSTATTPLPSLAARGGDEGGAGAGDEAADVRERDLVLVPVAEAI
jgi:hypothetical protein